MFVRSFVSHSFVRMFVDLAVCCRFVCLFLVGMFVFSFVRIMFICFVLFFPYICILASCLHVHRITSRFDSFNLYLVIYLFLSLLFDYLFLC